MASIINDLVVHVVDVPLKVAVETAHGRFTHQRSVVVEVLTSGGIVGWGEVDPVAGFSDLSADDIAAKVKSSASDFAGIDLNDRQAWRSRLALVRGGRQAVEMAILDAIAQTSGLPLGELFGRVLRHQIPLSGWIGWERPADAAALAHQWQRRGFAGVKVKIGSGIQSDVDRVSAVRDEVGAEMRLIVDAGEAYDADTTIALLRRLEPFDISACEQPVPRHDLSSLAEIRARTGTKIILDESVSTLAELERAIEAGAVDIIKLKLIKHEGVEAAVSLGLAAAERGVECTVGHGFALGLTALAEAHIASALPNFRGPGEMVGPLKMTFDVARPAPDLESGKLTLGSVPGLGAAADLDALTANAKQHLAAK